MTGADGTPDLLAPRHASAGSGAALTLLDVHKSFSHPVLRGVSATITPGAVTAVIGANGAGKTTLFNVLSGFTRPDRGRVLLGETPLSSRSPAAIARAGVGRLFQDVRLFPSLSVLDNLLVGLRLRTEAASLWPRTRRLCTSRADAYGRARDLLQRVGLDAHANRMPDELSYGQQKRLGIARALMSEPRVLLLDEPSSGIDMRNLNDLIALISGLRSAQRTIVLVEHNRGVVEQLADRVLFLDQGAVLRDGTVTDVFTDPEVAARYLGQ